jgi:uncharacterized membrane protein SpoIIM required for sporulation
LSHALSSLYQRAADMFGTPKLSAWNAFQRWFCVSVPDKVRELRAAIIIATSLFIGFCVTGWMMVQFAPELAELFMDPRQMDEVRDGKVWTDGLFGVIPGSVLSFQIMLNNIIVSLFAFAIGSIYGLGTIYILATNGLMLGALFSFTYQSGVGDRLLLFVVAHGFVELFVICIAAGCGLYLGDSLIHPRGKPRSQAFRDAMQNCVPVLLFGCAGLVICGLIEGYISPNPAFSFAVRLAVGLGWFAVFFALLIGLPWRKQRQTEAQRMMRIQAAAN